MLRLLTCTWLIGLILVSHGRMMAATPSGGIDISNSSIHILEQRLKQVDEELRNLSSFSFRNGVGALGYRSQPHQTSENLEWIQIDLGKEEVVDEVVLVPSIWRDTKSGFRADAFPEEFRIVVGSGDDDSGTVVASYDASDGLLPRMAPLVIPCGGVKGTWVRIEATKLSSRAWDGLYLLQLFEIFVFNGPDNVAIQSRVQVSSPYRNEGGARAKRFVVNGFVPYLMDAAHGIQSLAFNSKLGIGDEPTIIIDLGKEYAVDRLHLHAIDLSDTVPQVVSNDFGMPRWLVVEGSNDPDFKDFDRLTEYQMTSIYDAGPIVMRDFEPKSCRYVRLVALDPYRRAWRGEMRSQIGFAEIELFSKGVNVALNQKVSADFEVDSPIRSASTLTDGHNLYGEILPIRQWIHELAKRHDLEVERPLLTAELELRYSNQAMWLHRLGWIAVLLGAGIVITVTLGRVKRVRQVASIRERLAADLHDELGANIHTIGLLSDLASETEDDREELSTLHRRIRSETERSRIAVRYCINMLEADELNMDMEGDMQRAARRIMAKLEYDVEVAGQEFLMELSPHIRFSLFLFYKECLVNISRHAEATKFQANLTATKSGVVLTVSDNGIGNEEGEMVMPNSLMRRAKILKAKVKVEHPDSGGTLITLTLATKKSLLQKLLKT